MRFNRGGKERSGSACRSIVAIDAAVEGISNNHSSIARSLDAHSGLSAISAWDSARIVCIKATYRIVVIPVEIYIDSIPSTTVVEIYAACAAWDGYG